MNGLVLNRAGHYFTPNGGGEGSCQSATVAYVHPDDRPAGSQTAEEPKVNLKVLQHDAKDFERLDVPVVGVDAQPPLPQEIEDLKRTLKASSEASFHFTTQCPWHR